MSQIQNLCNEQERYLSELESLRQTQTELRLDLSSLKNWCSEEYRSKICKVVTMIE